MAELLEGFKQPALHNLSQIKDCLSTFFNTGGGGPTMLGASGAATCCILLTDDKDTANVFLFKHSK